VTPDRVVGPIARALEARGRRFALVGGLAVSLRAEVRFTRDVDLAVVAQDDADLERLVLDLRREGYGTVAVVEDERHGRVAITRIRSGSGVIVDLLVASSGIEAEIVGDASPLSLGGTSLPVAQADDLLAMKVLSMREARLQDRMDALNLLAIAPIDLERVRERLRLITARGYHRDQDLLAKLDALVAPAP
jgi:predicted nucleotidyltransferase